MLGLDTNLALASRVLSPVANHAAHRRRADANVGPALELLRQEREAARRDQARVVVQQDGIGAGGADAQVGVAREYKWLHAGHPAQARKARLSGCPRAVIHHNDPLRRQIRLCSTQGLHARHQVLGARRQDDDRKAHGLTACKVIVSRGPSMVRSIRSATTRNLA